MHSDKGTEPRSRAGGRADTALRAHTTGGEIVDEAVPVGGSGPGGPCVPSGSK